MNSTTVRRLAGLGLATAATTVALAAPATAGPVPPPDVQVQHAGSGYAPGGGSGSTSTPAASSGTDWAQIGYGAAGGVALFAAGAAGVIMIRRHQHLPHHA
jgi:hypothetical protein